MSQTKKSNKACANQKSHASKLSKIVVTLCIFLAACTNSTTCKEYSASIVDNLGSELGFPLYSWSPKTPPQAVIVAIHGATLHGRSYTTVAKHLSDKGYAVFSPDLRGFGAWYHNSEETDRLARHVLYRQSEKDLKNLLSKVRSLYPGKPVFIMGESVGANFAVRLLANDPTSADGAILSSPAIRQRFFFGPTVILQALTVFFVNPKAQLDITPYLRTRVSENDKITEERVNDPLGRNKLNAGELFKTRWFNKECLTFLPQMPTKASILVLEGSEDKLFKADDINNLMAQMPCEDKTLHILKGKGHIHLETAYLQPEVESVLDKWLAEKSIKYAQASSKVTVSSIDSSPPQP